MADDLATQALNEAAESDKFAETLQSLEQVIERNAQNLEEVKNELKERRQMLRNYFENDTQLSEAEEQLSEFKTGVKARKMVLQEEPQAVEIKIKLKELNERKKEIEESLSNHLVNHHRLTNAHSFDTSDGDQWEYTVSAKVKSRPNKKD